MSHPTALLHARPVSLPRLTSSPRLFPSLSTYGDYYFTMWGLILTLLGTALAALKTVVTNLIQTGGGGRLKLHPLDLLMRMSPLAFIQCVIYGWYTGELERVRKYGAREMTKTKAVGLLVNGIIAFGLNVVSFTANKKTSALTMSELDRSCWHAVRMCLVTDCPRSYRVRPLQLSLVSPTWFPCRPSFSSLSSDPVFLPPAVISLPQPT